MRVRSGADWIGRLQPRLTRYHVDLELGTPDAKALLKAQNAEAITVSDETGSTILFATNEPTISAVLEEYAHVLQHVKAIFADLDLVEMACHREIAVKECLVRHHDQLGVPSIEREQTMRQLEQHRRQLAEIEAWST